MGPAVPGYEILGELGRGGMGVVYQARQPTLDRTVALKMVLAGGHASADEVARFRAEAQAVARLQHPNVVQVYEVGDHAGLPYFSLEFCPGGSLSAALDGTPWDERRAAALVETLARAVHAAHAAGLVHRDIKPANVLFAADGTPKLTDFGVAKFLDAAASGRTATGAILGTPSYMAPEQAGGESKRVGPAADVYALGAVLYELLAGRPPFRAATPLDTVLQVVSEEPVPPSQLQRKVPRDLEAVCLACLEKDPARRYRSAEALADDLGRFTAGQPVRIRPAGPFDRAAKWARRNPMAAGWLAALPVTVVAGPTAGLVVGSAASVTAVPYRGTWFAVVVTALIGGVVSFFTLEVLRPGPETLTAFVQDLMTEKFNPQMPTSRERAVIPLAAAVIYFGVLAATVQSVVPLMRGWTPSARAGAFTAAAAVVATQLMVILLAKDVRAAEERWQIHVARTRYDPVPTRYDPSAWSAFGAGLHHYLTARVDFIDGFVWRVVPAVGAGLLCGAVGRRRLPDGTGLFGATAGLVIGAFAVIVVLQVFDEVDRLNNVGGVRVRPPFPFGAVSQGLWWAAGGFLGGCIGILWTARRR